MEVATWDPYGGVAATTDPYGGAELVEEDEEEEEEGVVEDAAAEYEVEEVVLDDLDEDPEGSGEGIEHVEEVHMFPEQVVEQTPQVAEAAEPLRVVVQESWEANPAEEGDLVEADEEGELVETVEVIDAEELLEHDSMEALEEAVEDTRTPRTPEPQEEGEGDSDAILGLQDDEISDISGKSEVAGEGVCDQQLDEEDDDVEIISANSSNKPIEEAPPEDNVDDEMSAESASENEEQVWLRNATLSQAIGNEESNATAEVAEVTAAFLDGLFEGSRDAYPQYVPCLSKYLISHPEALASRKKGGKGGKKGGGKRFFNCEERSQDVMADKVVSGCWACGKLDHDSQDCPFKRCFVCSGQGHEVAECKMKRVYCQRCRRQGHSEDACPDVFYQTALGHDDDASLCRCVKCGREGHLNCGRIPATNCGWVPATASSSRQQNFSGVGAYGGGAAAAPGRLCALAAAQGDAAPLGAVERRRQLQQKELLQRIGEKKREKEGGGAAAAPGRLCAPAAAQGDAAPLGAAVERLRQLQQKDRALEGFQPGVFRPPAYFRIRPSQSLAGWAPSPMPVPVPTSRPKPSKKSPAPLQQADHDAESQGDLDMDDVPDWQRCQVAGQRSEEPSKKSPAPLQQADHDAESQGDLDMDDVPDWQRCQVAGQRSAVRYAPRNGNSKGRHDGGCGVSEEDGGGCAGSWPGSKGQEGVWQQSGKGRPDIPDPEPSEKRQKR